MVVLNATFCSNSKPLDYQIISGSFGVVKFCNLREESRRGWEGRLKNGVRIKHMITVDQIEFLLPYNILVIYNYFGRNNVR